VVEAATVLPLSEDDDTAAVMDGYLRTMEQFLEAGAEIMQAYLATPESPVVEHAGFPLMGNVLSFEPGVELVARREFDPAEDRYLLDHTLGRTVSRTDPDLSALPLMPLAMSLELLAEAAACLVPGRLVTGMRDVRAYHWLSWEEAPQTLELRARRLDAYAGRDRVHVELRRVEDDATAGSAAVEADVLLDDVFPEPPSPIAVDPSEGRPSRFEPGRVYDEAMFHGESWQAVRAVDLVAPAAAVATLEALPRTRMLRSDPDPAFVLDPVILDAAGQVIGFWAADRLEHGRVVFPFRLAALDLYGPPPVPGENMSCLASIALVGEALVRSDIDVLDAGGRPRMRLTAWEDKRFEVPDRFRALTVPAALPPLSTNWQEPAVPYSGEPVACRLLDARLPVDRGLWKPVWASRVLGRRERERFAHLGLPEERQLEWLGARTAAKEAIAELLRAAHGLDLLPAEIEILPGTDGAPLVDAPGLQGLEVAPIVSLAHAQGAAVAFAALVPKAESVAVGIDIEHLRPLPPAFADAALRGEERSVLEQVPTELGDEWLLRCWCAKEAVGKALGSGLAPGRPEAPEVVSVDRDRQQVVVDARGRRFVAHTHRDGDLIVATTLSMRRSGKGQP
jgi:phosphopantetheinyl transferase (holo-ACP synthase)